MLQKRISILFFLFLLAIAGSLPASAKEGDIPAPKGDIYVQDFANVLNPSEKQQLIGLGRAVQDKVGAQVAVLTVDTTGGKEMTEFANEAFRSYGIGSKERNDGVLLVLAIKDKSIRIEVGYGLEGTITDGKAGSILDQYAIPSLKAGQPNQAVIQTYQALANEVTGESMKAGDSNPQQQTQQGSGIPTWLFIIIVIGVLFLDFTFFGGTLSYALLSILSRGGTGGGGGPRGGGGGSSGGGGAGRNW